MKGKIAQPATIDLNKLQGLITILNTKYHAFDDRFNIDYALSFIYSIRNKTKEYGPDYAFYLERQYLLNALEMKSSKLLDVLMAKTNFTELANSLGIEFIKAFYSSRNNNKNNFDESYIEKFSKLGIDLNASDEEGSNILHYAAREPSYYNDCFKHPKLLQAIDINKFNDEGDTPLHILASNNEEISSLKQSYIWYLLTSGANIDLVNPLTGDTVLNKLTKMYVEKYFLRGLIEKYQPKNIYLRNFDKINLIDNAYSSFDNTGLIELFRDDLKLNKYAGIKGYVALEFEDLGLIRSALAGRLNLKDAKGLLTNLQEFLPIFLEVSAAQGVGKSYFTFNFYQKYIKSSIEAIFSEYSEQINRKDYKELDHYIEQIDNYIADNFFEIACIAKAYNGHTLSDISALSEAMKGVSLSDIHLARGLIEEYNYNKSLEDKIKIEDVTNLSESSIDPLGSTLVNQESHE
ncbi:MAG: hypothetical protein K0Q51_675 [Rickettsiaceae bacterium]|jgi:hypothetical protein|nr:hypothetical protein [Rickettsiaceae bacterium]